VNQVNIAVDKINNLHFKTTYYSKYYTDNDTSRFDGETWLLKVKTDTVLGMHIRNISQYEDAHLETLHKGSTTWLINHDKDTIIKYNQTEGHWDGFNGNTKTSWTTETPLNMGIHYDDEEDSLTIIQLENLDWLIQRFSPDVLEYSIHDITDMWWVDHLTMLPYRSINQWKIGERETYDELNIELLDTTQHAVKYGLNKPLPDYPVIDYVEPDPKQFEPLSEGAKVPKLNGYFLQDSTAFDLSNYLDSPLIMIDFWYQSCGPCIRAIPYLDSLEREFGQNGFLLIEVNSRDHKTEKTELIDFVKQRGGRTEMIVMTDLNTERKTWKCYLNPTFYLIRKGEIVWVQQGFAPEIMSEFREKIMQYLEKN
jgi:thiol-disulfide isomerase/thioredoxin